MTLDHSSPELLLADLEQYAPFKPGSVPTNLFRFEFKDANGSQRQSKYQWQLIYAGVIGSPVCKSVPRYIGVWLHVKYMAFTGNRRVLPDQRQTTVQRPLIQSVIEFRLENGWLTPLKTGLRVFGKDVWGDVWRLLFDNCSVDRSRSIEDSMRNKTNDNLRGIFS